MPMTADDRIRLIRIKIERANKHIAELEDAILQSGVLHGKTARANMDAEPGEPFLHFGSFNVYAPEIPAMIGDAAHNLRSALDHLAYHLVWVGTDNGEVRSQGWEKIQFPIAHSADSYKSDRTAGKVQGMERKAIEAIDALKPYKGGNEPLWLLNKIDNADKHSFILPIGEDVIIAGVSLRASEPFFTSVGDSEANEDVNLPCGESLIEPAVGQANAVIPALHKLSHLVSNLVEGFRPFLGSNASPSAEVSPLDMFDSFEFGEFPWDG
jgi:hypothetical protein